MNPLPNPHAYLHPHQSIRPSVCLSRAVLDLNLCDDDSFLYEEAPELLRFRSASPPIPVLTDWYLSRAQDIDSCSRQVGSGIAVGQGLGLW